MGDKDAARRTMRQAGVVCDVVGDVEQADRR